ncbi:uncharacterized protein LOC128232830 [Mya arenaria]|uniref:uncharacterized protein LOC128232830 n=1 Tax=Mya arenaria TaxID=6604 RepID=UPI0022E5CE3F|nr:uncharacterized protein LOC128232830 [Mya arenaria]
MVLRQVRWWVCRRRGSAIWALMMVIGTLMLIYLTQNRFTFSELTPTPEEKIYQESTSSGKKSSILKDTKDLPVEDGFSRAEYLRSACKNNIHRSGKRKVRVSFDPHVNAVYCPLCKIASTFLTRMFRMIALITGVYQTGQCTPLLTFLSQMHLLPQIIWTLTSGLSATKMQVTVFGLCL